ncbi:MAG: 2-oxoglutarate dehydrogenase E1 component [Alphaproteobacteria bacterium]|nr:2-oxoglutarate dehydrogenase E1 component [Alphaproteobacteria bacterium]
MNAPDKRQPDGLDSLLTGENAAWVDAQYARWSADPASVDPEWAELFASWGGAGSGGFTHHPAGITPSFPARSIFGGGGRTSADPDEIMAVAARQARIMMMVNAYRVRGHTEADIDPLGRHMPEPHPELTLGYYGLSEADLDHPCSGQGVFGVPEVTTLRHLIQRMRTAYCGGFGIEFMNIGEPSKKAWLQERIETLQDHRVMTRDEALKALRLMADAQHFEGMLHTKFPGTKRFSLEGAETLVPLLHDLIESVSARGVTNIIIGMAHRGRLNVLANILEKPVKQIVAEFQDQSETSFEGSGDVKYHLGYTSYYHTAAGPQVLLALAFNPSHLEAVNPVVEGRVRARQDREGDTEHARYMPILVHGDAAFAGQGLVCETLNLSDLRGYRTGGTVHIVVNNQIGFTTSPVDARSTPYATDVARMLAVPIFHVNGEDPEAVAAVAQLASDWRQTFHQDVVIDMYCYRKHGHNEGDEPSFTQPLLYDDIRRRPTPLEIYARRLVQAYDSIAQADVDAVIQDSQERLDRLLQADAPIKWDSYEGNTSSPMGKLWTPFRQGHKLADGADTTFPKERLQDLLVRANTIPEGFQAHRKIERLMEQRLEIARGERPVDWAVGEQAAYATLVATGTPVRLSGQDSGRGTFSHRHAVLTDIRNGDEYVGLDRMLGHQARFQVFDSLLSEAAVLGFEFGYTLDYPDALVLWEAQFGDFANGAQVIIDNFIMATEQKWNRFSGLVMLLPHGYEGQGPEHSSARLERFLQGCAEDNVIVANATTPASFFHLLRRQALMRVRKPLIVMSPKSLLRHPRCVSTLDELAEGSFQPVIPDAVVDLAKARRVVFCAGKVYYDLLEAREQRGIDDVALIRLEQLHPFPADQVLALCNAACSGAEVVWAQEEPRNMGAWPMMDEWMTDALGVRPRYAGRPAAAAPATGSHKKHKAEQAALIDAALGGGAKG